MNKTAPHKLDSKEGDSRIWFFTPEVHKKLLEDFRAFKANNYIKP